MAYGCKPFLAKTSEITGIEFGKVRPLGAPVLIIYYQYTPPFELRFAELFKRNKHTDNALPLKLSYYLLRLLLSEIFGYLNFCLLSCHFFVMQTNVLLIGVR